MKTFHSILIVILILIIFFEIIILASVKTHPLTIRVEEQIPVNPTPGFQVEDLNGERRIWERAIDGLGAEEAYEAFKRQHQALDFRKQHTLAHLFGVILYEKMGLPGITVCDSTFAFGCYHSFFGSAISEQGIDVVYTLDEKCVERWSILGLGCSHGLGHGVLSYMGLDDLQEALELCATLSWKGPIGGCSSGVFMEYNFQTMVDSSDSEVFTRILDSENPYIPCSWLPKRFLQACYFAQPEWWARVYQDDYRKIGTLCNGTESIVLREACFRGIGYVAASTSNFDVETTIQHCEQMSSKEAEVLCRAGASWNFFAHPNVRDVSSKLCNTLEKNEAEICDQKSDIYKQEEYSTRS